MNFCGGILISPHATTSMAAAHNFWAAQTLSLGPYLQEEEEYNYSVVWPRHKSTNYSPELLASQPTKMTDTAHND